MAVASLSPRRTTRIVTRFFDGVASAYDTPTLQRLVYQPVQDQVLDELTRLQPARVLDIGCGTGILATRIQDTLVPDAVYGCDASPGMLAQARARSRAVTWLDGTAEHIPLPDDAVEAAVSTTAFHFFDQPAALRELHRVLAPGGTVLIAAAVTATSVGAAAMAPLGRVAGWHVPSRSGLRELFEEAGFVDVRQLTPARGPVGVLDPMLVTVGRVASTD